MKDAPTSFLADTELPAAVPRETADPGPKTVVVPAVKEIAVAPVKLATGGLNLRMFAIWGGVVGLIAAVALYLNWSNLFGVLLVPVQAVRGEIVQTIVVNGTVETVSRVNLGSQIIGIVMKVFVKEGDMVRAGDTLIELQSDDARAQVGQALASVGQAEAKLDLFGTLTGPVAKQLVAQTASAQNNLAQQLDRTSKLFRRGYATRAQLDVAQSNFDVAAAQSRSASLSLQNASPGGRDVAFAGSALDAARASLRAAKSRLALTSVKAPVDGVVISRTAEAGQIAQPGAPLLILAPSGRKRLVVQIDERNLGLIRVGQAAVASADAYPKDRFNAVLATIGPAIDVQRGSIEAKFDVPESPGYLIEDMTVSVDVEVARRKDALTLPVGTVRDAASKPRVLVIVDGRTVDRSIVLGARGQASVEVISGLSETDLVVPPGRFEVVAGQVVRVQSARASP